MMKNITRLACWLILLFNVTVTLARQQENISVPSTPAFSILNFEPAAIMRPSNPKELSADILNSLDKDGKLLLNVGLEVAPYWLRSRPNLSRDQYENASGMQLFFQSLMLSAATVKDSATGSNKLGTGLRFKVKAGNVSAEFVAKQNELQQISTIMAAVATARSMVSLIANTDSLVSFVDRSITSVSGANRDLFRTIAGRIKNNYGNTPGELRRFAEDINVEISNSTETLRKEVVMLAKKRTGLIIELAAATSFITNSTDQFEKAGVWLNASHVMSATDAFNFSVRYFFTSKDSVTTNIDFGLSYIKELKNFGVSVEALARSYSTEFSDVNQDGDPITRVEKDFTYRLAVQAAYRIAEDISVNLSVGKDFDSPFLERSGYFSIFGINYSIFKNASAAP